MAKPKAVIIGAGRMGQGLGLALQRRGYAAVLVARSARSVPPPLVLQVGDPGKVTPQAEVILIATPDDAIASVAEELAREGAVGRDQVVLHLSGLLDRTALAALDDSTAGLGSFHPLQTVAEPATAAERLKGAYVGIEGDHRALEAAERLAKTLRMLPITLSAAAKPAYHAGATMVANYAAALVGIAERLAVGAGVPIEIAQKIYLPLLNGAAQNITTLGAVRSLTGPVRRGDLRTIEAHLAALAEGDRIVYRSLGLAALDLAKREGVDPERAAAVEKLFRAGSTDRRP